MKIGAKWRFATHPAKMATPVIAVFLASAAGVAGSAEPLYAMRASVGLAQPRPATIRIVLPEPIRMTPAVPGQAAGIVRFLLPPTKVEIAPAAPPAQVDHPVVTPPVALASAALNKPVGRISLASLQHIAPTSVPSIAYKNPTDARSPAALTSARETAGFAPSAIARPLAPEPVAQSLTAARLDAGAQLRGGNLGEYQRTMTGLSFKVLTKVNGTAAGPVSLLIRDGNNIAIRLTDLLGIIEPAVDPAVFETLKAAQAARSYVTLNDLRAAGIPVRFDDSDRLVFGRR